MKSSKRNTSECKSKKNPASDTLNMKCNDKIDTDPDGSWTGTPNDISEVPVQDVDDL